MRMQICVLAGWIAVSQVLSGIIKLPGKYKMRKGTLRSRDYINCNHISVYLQGIFVSGWANLHIPPPKQGSEAWIISYDLLGWVTGNSDLIWKMWNKMLLLFSTRIYFSSRLDAQHSQCTVAAAVADNDDDDDGCDLVGEMDGDDDLDGWNWWSTPYIVSHDVDGGGSCMLRVLVVVVSPTRLLLEPTYKEHKILWIYEQPKWQQPRTMYVYVLVLSREDLPWLWQACVVEEKP